MRAVYSILFLLEEGGGGHRLEDVVHRGPREQLQGARGSSDI